jgi:hypothetical protein
MQRKHFFLFFVYNHAPREKKEAGTMPSAAKGVASPWFLVKDQKPADDESEPNYSLCSIKFRRIRSTDVFLKNSKNWNSVCSTCLYCTAPEFNANAVPALREMFQPLLFLFSDPHSLVLYR